MIALAPRLVPAEETVATTIPALYARFDQQAARWAAKTGVSCPTGCGRCCETTVPPCSDAEARLIAHHLLDSHHERLDTILNRDPDGIDSGPPCPFYSAEGDYHCTIYAVRPFFCRAFGYASATDKRGRPAYRLCKHMPAPVSFAGSRELPLRDAEHPSLPLPPSMSVVQARIDGVSEGLSEPTPIDRAVRSQIERILIARQYARAEAFVDATCAPAHQFDSTDPERDPERTDPSPPIAPGSRSA
ncbi:MAG: YkgJ family cysteine cluster protein [Spirochaetaceae bacterium]|nr:MAG: YkgJ family cysteine cluster protein [Spirochaetaceae bacterium]